ncbi:MAG TPA: hypothetical protein VK970_25130 [Candidatus Methylacidiphilales bacterium]|nr:hypothetical protein [Candidatus Methylacidiphilales bacterium]
MNIRVFLRLLPILAVCSIAVLSWAGEAPNSTETTMSAPATNAPSTSAAAAPADPAPAASRKLMYNSDGNHLFHGERRPADPRAYWHNRHDPKVPELTVEEFLAHVDEVARPGSQVGTFLICPVSYQVVMYRGVLEKRLGDGLTDEQFAVTAPAIRSSVTALRHFDVLGVDPFTLLVKRIKEKGMAAVVTWRVQQAHVIAGEEKAAAMSPFWQEHPELRLKGGSGGGEKDAALDFAKPEVRERKLALIREFVTKYNMDGVQLDFQRFPLFFVKGKEEAGIPLMNQFVQSVRQMLDDEGRKAGRRLTLGVRVPENPARCRELGLDPAAWVNEGWLDSVVVSTFLSQCVVSPYGVPHYEMDIQAFRELFRKPVALYGAIQTYYIVTDTTNGGKKLVQFVLSPDDYRKEAQRLWKKGVDGIELFNFFMSRSKGSVAGRRKEPPFFLMKELGDPALIGKVNAPEEAEWSKIYPAEPAVEKYRAPLPDASR